ncbi:C-4 sterol methyl oxidase, partial [Coemansia sp. BCRC 34490]
MANRTTAEALLEQFISELKTTGSINSVIPSGYTPTWAERMWFSLFNGRNEAITFGIIAFAVHQIVYYGRYLPYYICDYIPAMQKYKLQPDKEISNEQWWKCLRSLLFSQVFVQLPMMMFFLPAAKIVG